MYLLNLVEHPVKIHQPGILVHYKYIEMLRLKLHRVAMVDSMK